MGRSLKTGKKEELFHRVGPYAYRERSLSKSNLNFTVRGIAPETMGRQFSLTKTGPANWAVNWTYSGGKRKRFTFAADSVETAVVLASEILFGSEEAPSGLRVSEVFLRWEQTLSCTQETVTEYDKAVEAFLLWIDKQRAVRYWADLRLEHVERYVSDLQKAGYSKNYIHRRVAPVKQACRWASRNWPEKFRNFAEGVKIRDGRGQAAAARSYLSLQRLGEFLVQLADAEDWNILPGVALQGACSLRLKEAFRLRWSDIDLGNGMIVVRGEKNTHSVRRIPVPAVVLEILEAAPRNGERVLSGFSDWRNYGRAVGKRLRGFLAAANVEPKGLRRTLPSEAWKAGWYGDALQVYRGHSPGRTSAIDWNHYIVVEPEKLNEMFLDQVVSHVDAALAEFRGMFLSGKSGGQSGCSGNVVELKVA